MKKGLILAVFAAAMLAMPSAASAHDFDSDDSSYPMRYVAYAIHPVGVAIKDFIFRPIHRLVSTNEETAYWFGHEPREGDQY